MDHYYFGINNRGAL